MAGRWDTHTCACYEDPCTCCTVCCLPSVAIGQLAHNVLGYPCVLVTLLLFTLFAMHQSVQSYMRDMPFVEDQTDNPVRCYVPLKLAPPLTNMTALLGGDEEGNACLPHPLVTALSSASFCAMFVFVLVIRRAIRKQDRIPQEHCADCCGINGAEDCCCAFWCGPCSTCQMMRHLGMHGKHYSVLSPTGTAFEEDEGEKMSMMKV